MRAGKYMQTVGKTRQRGSNREVEATIYCKSCRAHHNRKKIDWSRVIAAAYKARGELDRIFNQAAD
jgi:hypothetical protein